MMDFAHAIKAKDPDGQREAIKAIKQNVQDWNVLLVLVFPDFVRSVFGDNIRRSLEESAQDEIALCFGIMNCHCGEDIGRCGVCDNAQLARTSHQDVLNNHKALAKTLALVSGHEKAWNAVWNKQLNTLETFCTSLARDHPDQDMARERCFAVGKELAQAMDQGLSMASRGGGGGGAAGSPTQRK